MTDHSSGVSFERFKATRESHETRFCSDFVQTGKDLLEVTFESDLFEFSVEDSSPDMNLILPERKSSWFPDFSVLQEQEDTSPEPMKVQVSVHEQLSAIYDEFSQEGSISVSGTVHVKSASAISFQLAFDDSEKFIQSIEAVQSVCGSTSSMADPLLRIELHPLHVNEAVMVATYVCGPKLRPVPLLIKSRVSTVKGFSRVGFKIRANPNSGDALTDMAVMIAVPPDVDGSRCKMSRKGGSWDMMKRTLTWYITSLAPGEALEIQAQFPLMDENSRVLKFPVLVQCQFSSLFSNMTVSSKDSSVRLALCTSGQILHRKV